MIKKRLGSMYTHFIAYFLGAFMLALLSTFLVVSVTQMGKVENTLKASITKRINDIKALSDNFHLPAEKISDYMGTDDIYIEVYDRIENTEMPFSEKQISALKKGEVLFFNNASPKANFLAIVQINNHYIVVEPNYENDLIKFIHTMQWTNFAILIIVGSGLTLLAVARVVRPIKAISVASQKVAAGNLKVQVEVKGNDEVADLAGNFNTMVNALNANEYLHKEFVSNVSHEFKTPITSLKGYAKLLKNDALTEDKKQEYADIIIAESERLSNLSSNLLKLSELDNIVIRKEKAVFSLSEQLRNAVLLLQNEWERKNLELDLDIDEISVEGDKELLYQAWINLISNAIKYSGDHGILRVMLKKTNKIQVRIIDSGVGIAPENMDKIFLRFYKADKSRNSTGTGLGLPIVKKIIDLHGGSIEVKSECGKGSEFIVTL